MENIGIYVHIPFCVKKCYYCDFCSYPNKLDLQKDYVHTLKEEIKLRSKEIKNYVDTIYIGGGTPSVINEKYILEILNSIKENYKVKKNAEITIEVNPGTVTENKLKEYKNAGINRLSIGLQSTKNELLEEIGRIHKYEDFLETYNLAKKVGFRNINVDLMIGLPEQTLEDVQNSLMEIIKLNPKHISVYSLILEEDTKLEVLVNLGKLDLITDELERQMYWEVKETLEANGYEHYEISNFAKKGYKSKHNYNCWKQHSYLGFGASAHSYYNNIRYCNTHKLEEYLKDPEAKIIQERQTIEDAKKEYMLLGLRTLEGINISEFKQKYVDNPLYLFKNELNKLTNEGLVEIDLDNIKLTQKGLDLANIVWEEFI
ncbi:MAG: radical SAM family heme chaperone HemW [Clostridia bacterium]|jgi:putative coproporphyrinogen dehydrogenase|nr:radical SAM family heme chaperone HemW [Clostridia bacterium]HJJ13044.1 radical SAM family heme chaperone HemW [Clostridiaceae bacterium]